MLKFNANQIRGFFLFGLLIVSSNKSQASAPALSVTVPGLPVAVYAIPATLSMIIAGVAGWGWWSSNKQIKELQEQQKQTHASVQEVQGTQKQHTAQLNKLQTTTDENFKSLDEDLKRANEKLDTMRDESKKQYTALHQGQQVLLQSGDQSRGALERRLDVLVAEVAQLRSLIEQTNNAAEGRTKPPVNATAQAQKPSGTAPYLRKSIYEASPANQNQTTS